MTQKHKRPIQKPGGRGKTNLVDSFFQHLRSNRILAALVIAGTVVISLAKFTDSTSKLSDFFQRLTQSEKERSVKTLQSRKIDANALSLLKSASTGDDETVSLLLKAGISPEAKDPQGWTALHWAAKTGSVPVVRSLLSSHADVNATDYSGQTPLMEAAAYCHDEVMSTLVAGGADLRSQSSATALFWAADAGCDKSIALLVGAGIDVNRRQKLDWTALMAAAEKGHLNVVQALLRAGADQNISNADGKTAQMLAREKGHSEVVALLQQPNP